MSKYLKLFGLLMLSVLLILATPIILLINLVRFLFDIDDFVYCPSDIVKDYIYDWKKIKDELDEVLEDEK